MGTTAPLHLTHSRPLPTTTRHHRRPVRTLAVTAPMATLPLLLIIKHQLQHIVRELRELETHSTELWLCLVAQTERAGSPEGGDRFADRLVFGVGFLVDEAGVGELALCCGGSAVDFAVREGLEVGELEAVGEGVDAGVDEEAKAFVVGDGHAGVFLEGGVARGGGLLGEVFACVEVLDGGAHGVDVDVGHGDLTWLT